MALQLSGRRTRAVGCVTAALMAALTACSGDGVANYGPDDLLGALSDSSGFDSESIRCIDAARDDAGFERTVEAVFDCSDIEDRRAALIGLIFSVQAQSAFDGAALPVDLDVDDFVDCMGEELGTTSGSVIDEIWEEATSMQSLGEQAGLATGPACIGIVADQLVGDTQLTGDDIIREVLDAIGADAATVDPLAVEQDGVLVTYIAAPVELATVAGATDGVVISFELAVSSPATGDEIVAADTALRLFGFDADAEALLAPGPPTREVTADGYLGCVEGGVDQISLRIVPTALTCDRL